ncbi:LytR/AlgR family response regulator transcription factor [Aliikangiella coralliicola]|uniref:LytTR family transcriptional regulator n=1 Tax=Aliikangiella coralliicola TaxID=2592383 RepID=A0A545UFG4_9GAMM|nr:LytTR family DNA-binding domain-containing protein [Aliikangiella coralliicola]TQV88207.1 LytTR family transcriptional regulator [Aliikangiella coralliicola]
MNWQLFNRYEHYYIALFWISITSLQAWINAESVIADYARLEIPIEAWQPYSWEFSSQFVSVLLIPLIILFNRKFSLSGPNITRGIIGHVIFSVVFSLSHVVGMVLIRKLTYSLMGSHYDFGDWSNELLYEYRKDVYSYIWIIAIIYAYRFIVSRLRGEATVIATGEDTPEPEHPERLLVKKLGKEFIIKVSDINWVEAAGNYMNLHVDNRVYPLRETMAGLERKLNPKHFARIHRSFMVNIDNIEEINPLDSGDFRIRLKCGKVLNFSRRYREKVKDRLA